MMSCWTGRRVILASSKDRHPSVVQLRTENVVPEAVVQRVAETMTLVASDLAQGALVTIDPARHRVRLLPLTR